MSLFEPFTVGDLRLPNRIIMAPLTRNRATMPGRVPNALMREYYVQRASAGLIVSEATSVEPRGVGYPSTPGIWSNDQVAGWKQITDGVHAAGGRIFSQLWHVGRISDPSYHDGALPVGPSAIPAAGHVSLLRPKREYVAPHALETHEVANIVGAFAQGAINAKAAGFDGIELHAANGYLIDQFLQDSTNKRSDRYGGSIENRARLLLEIIDTVSKTWNASRIGVHLAPRCDAHDMGDSNPSALFGYVVAELSRRNIAFILARESLKEPRLSPKLRTMFKGTWIANEGLALADAERLVKAGEADAVAFGKDFISNPDLVGRLKQGAALTPWAMETFYSEGPHGYTDYAALRAAAGA